MNVRLLEAAAPQTTRPPRHPPPPRERVAGGLAWVAGVWGAAAPQKSETQNECPRVGLGVGRGVVILC